MGQQRIRVAIVEDDRRIRDLLRNALDRSEGIQVVQAFTDAEEYLATLPRLDLSVAIMDINLPGMNGIDCIREAKLVKPEVQYMVLTVFENPAYLFQALCAGATGYLVKNAPDDVLIGAVRDIHAGGSPMSSAIARLVVGSFQRETQQRILDDRLTEREKSLLDQLANGLLYKEIAAKWDISIETVRKHARNIYAKLQVGTRTEAIRKIYPDR
jgi:DNA-binding NarL/FixJ family response regulator